jgi:hypothetical protein
MKKRVVLLLLAVIFFGGLIFVIRPPAQRKSPDRAACNAKSGCGGAAGLAERVKAPKGLAECQVGRPVSRDRM